MANLTQREIKEINKLRGLFPSQINVSISRVEDGTFLARIDTFEGARTEAGNFSELIEMVNDAVKTYLEVPEKFLSYMPSYIPSIELAQKLNVFPVMEVKENVILPLAR
jgi:predicted RNase H-like HicB family nuclease